MKYFRKRHLLIIAVLILSFAMSGTYAWFVAESRSGAENILLGDLGITVAFDLDDELLEPGLDVTKTATFTNAGTMPLCAQLELDTEITIYRDTSGELLSNPDGVPAPATDNYVTVNVDIDNLTAEGVVEIGGESCVFAWMYDKNSPGSLYLLADPKVAVDMDFIVEISGATPNQYMSAKISFDNSVRATQINSDAILEELGIDVADLGYVSELQGKTYAGHPAVTAWVNAQLGR